MKLASGKMNKYIRIEKRTGEKDALNQQLDEWVVVLSTWAHALGSTGMGTIRQSQTVEGVTRDIAQYSYRIRYRGFLKFDNGMRVNWKGIFFDIKQINHDMEKQEWTDIVCEVGGNNG